MIISMKDWPFRLRTLPQKDADFHPFSFHLVQRDKKIFELDYLSDDINAVFLWEFHAVSFSHDLKGLPCFLCPSLGQQPSRTLTNSTVIESRMAINSVGSENKEYLVQQFGFGLVSPY